MDLSKLNPPQREAVIHGGGPLLVLAGAGSGKTRVITYRIAYLLRGGIPPHGIAALTFTNKAAEEMRERVGKLVGDRKTAAKLTVGTFHSLGLQIIRREYKALGIPSGFTIYDAADQLGTVRELLRTVHVTDRRFDVKAILTRISLAKNRFVRPGEYRPAEVDEYDEITAEIYPRYQEALRAYAALDFDDLITETVRLFEENAEVRERWQRRFRHVLVDEYQDTNRAQLMLVKHLCGDHGNLCVVGDDDQSIYSWRGADPANILSFERVFPGAKVVKLEQNYRSTPTILNAANAVIANNENRHGKTLWSNRPDGDLLAHVVATDSEHEAKFVTREIGQLTRGGRWSYRDTAILYRSNVQSRILEEELRTACIPYVMYGGQQFFERKEVKDLIAYLRLALNSRDEIALRRIINYPARGIGATTLERISARAQAETTTMWNVLERIDEAMSKQIRPGTRQAIGAFVALMQKVRQGLEAGQSGAAVARVLVEDIELYADLHSAAGSHSAAQRRIDNIESLFSSLERQHERSPGLSALAQYLRQLSLVNDGDDTPDPGDKIVLTTLHGAKGLEFPVVFMVGMEEELLPHARTLAPQVTDVFDPDHASDVSEERRLAYVGMTRAQDKLYLTRSALRRIRGRTTERTPSRFLLEVPKHFTVQRDATAEAHELVPTDELSALFKSIAAQLSDD
ncbi:MAG: UvrD-helicase domain-containing protein [Proteobacteria bacterium]|nr:UvrD-helicase domain-containing protein [Pseudomonadota bacterium]